MLANKTVDQSTMNVNEDIQEAPSSITTQPDEYYYRVDAWVALRGLQAENDFLPARWDAMQRPWPHKSLLRARSELQPEHGIFRMSFWDHLDAAERDLATRGIWQPHLMLRVRRNDVLRALRGWTVEEDDYLPGDAHLLWRCQPLESAEPRRFAESGVPLKRFDVRDPRTGEWRPWHSAPALQPDSARMVAFGWLPIGMHTRQGGEVLAYWKVLPDAESRGGGPAKFWLLLTLDALSRGTLGSEDDAVGWAVEQLLVGPLAAMSAANVQVLTVHPTGERVWTEQFGLDWVADEPHRSWLAQRIRRLAGLGPVQRLRAEPRHLIGPEGKARLILRSLLREVRPEYPDHVWDGELSALG